MRATLIDLTGQRFGRLTVVTQAKALPSGRARWECRCDCGGSGAYQSDYLRNGRTRSCGCLRAEMVARRNRDEAPHGKHGSGVYKTWRAMIGRCEHPGNASFVRYGARGITVCDRWRQSFPDFYADMGDRPEGRSLDRIDNDKGYEPGNCRWATTAEQMRNRRPRSRRGS